MKRIAAIIAIAVLLVALGGLIIYKGSRQAEADIESRFNTAQFVMARHIADSIEQALNNIKAEMMITAMLPSIQKGAHRCSACMEEVYEELKGEIEFLYRLDKEGEATHFFPERAVEQIESKDSGFKLCITAPILVNGRPAGVIGARIDLSLLIHKEIEPGMMQTGKTGYVWIIDDQGRFIFHPEGKFIGRDAFIVRKERAPDVSFEAVNRIMREKMMRGKNGVDVYFSGWHREQRGEIKKLIAYCPFRIGARQYSLALITPASEVTSLTQENFRNTFLLIGIVILIGLIGLLVILYIDQQRMKHLEKEKELGKEIKDSKERYRTLIEEAFDGIFVQIGARIVFANQRLHDMLGYGDGELVGMDHWLVYTPEYQDITRERGKARMRGEEVVSRYEVKLQRKDGSWLYGEINARVIGFGEDRGVVVWLRDVTERKQAEKALQQEKAYAESIVSSVPDMLLVINPEGEISYGNDTLARFAGVELKEVVGKPLGQIIGELKLLTPETAVILMERMKKRLQTSEPITDVEVEVINGRGERVPCIYSASGIKGPDSKVMGEVVLIRDITERVHLEKKIKESEERYRHLIEHANAGIILVSGEYFVFANKKMSEMVGYTIEELTSTPFLEFIAPRDRQLIEERYRRRQRGEKLPQIYDFWMIRRDGTEICVELDASLTEVNGEIATLGVMKDKTEKKKAEADLLYFKEYNERIVASIPASLLVLDKNLNIKSVNRTYRETRGIKDEDVVGKNIKEVFPHEILKEGGMLQAFEEVMETKEPRYLYGVKHASSDHPEKILNITVSGLRRAEEEATLILVIEDVTERARLQEEIRESRDFMDTIFKTSVDMVATTDERGIITFVNRAMERIAGYKEEDLIGRHVSEFYDRGRERAKDIMGTLTTGRPLEDYRMSFLSKRGREIPTSFSGASLKDSQGRVIGALGFLRDISRRVKAEEELQKKNKELENFVYIVSHDLKSPIVSMQGFSSMLLNEYHEKLGAEGKRYIERIRANASRMEVLISDLLALSRVGRVVGAFKDVSSLEIANRVCKSLESRMEESGTEVFIGDNLPTIRCDGERIYQVFENLLVNAVKFTGGAEKPKIEIGHEEREGFHRFHVRDNGIGIDPEYHRKIFEIFHRLNEIEDNEGTGIGLVIVERIISNHGGKVWVESEKGKGATFYFTLPRVAMQK